MSRRYQSNSAHAETVYIKSTSVDNYNINLMQPIRIFPFIDISSINDPLEFQSIVFAQLLYFQCNEKLVLSEL